MHANQSESSSLTERFAYIQNSRSLLQNIVSSIGLFCKRDLNFEGAYTTHIHTNQSESHRQVRIHKVQVSLAEYCLFYRALFQMRPIICTESSSLTDIFAYTPTHPHTHSPNTHTHTHETLTDTYDYVNIAVSMTL